MLCRQSTLCRGQRGRRSHHRGIGIGLDGESLKWPTSWTVTLVIGLVLWPEITLRVMWNLLIPVLPASFLIAPQLWRGICPLATLNQWSSGLLGRRQLGGRLLIAANALGILLLVLLVPARRFLFNENGPALAGTIAIVALAALDPWRPIR